ncbi:hypothetical protein [Luteolibacter yonseiensis]
MNARRIQCSLKYWLGKFCKNFLGICRACGTGLNYTRHGQGVCPKCSRRY